MRNSLLVGIVALLLGMGAGMGAMSLLSADDGPSLAKNPGKTRSASKDRAGKKAESNSDSGRKTRRPRPDNKPKPVDVDKPKPIEPKEVDPEKDLAFSEADLGITRIEGAIVGTVFDGDGKAMSGVTVYAHPNISPKANKSGYSTPTNDGSPPPLVFEENEIAKQLKAANRKYALSATTRSDGTYEFTDLIDTNYTLSAYKVGHRAHAHGSTYVKAGGRVDFSFQPIRSVVVNVKMPDGSEPEEAFVTIGSGSTSGRYRGWGNDKRSYEMDYLATSRLSSFPSISAPNYGGRGGASHRWTPTNREIPLNEGVWTVSAYKGDHDYVSQNKNVNALSAGVEIPAITLNLKALTGLKVTLTQEGEGIPKHQYKVHVRRSALGAIQDSELDSKGKYLSHSYTGVYTSNDLAPDSYVVSIVYAKKVIAETTVSVVKDTKAETELAIPEPKREDFVVVELEGVKPYQRANVTFQVGYIGEKREQKSYASYPIRRKDGTVWVPHYSAGKGAPAGAMHFVEATLNGVGVARSEYVKGPASTARIVFQEPGYLRVQFSGFDADSDAHKSVTVQVTPEKDENNSSSSKKRRYYSYNNRSSGQVGKVDDSGVLFVTGITPGRYVVKVKFSGTYQKLTMESQNITIGSGMNNMRAQMPALFNLKVTFAEGTLKKNQNYVYLYKDGSYLSYKYLKNGVADFGKFPAGDYRVQIPSGKYMNVNLQSRLDLYFTPND